jgi:hypothetical protein
MINFFLHTVTPDRIRILNSSADEWQGTLAEFLALEPEYPGLPSGMTTRYQTQDRQYVTDGNIYNSDPFNALQYCSNLGNYPEYTPTLPYDRLVNPGMWFDGVDDWVDCKKGSQFAFTSAFSVSVEVFINPQGTLPIAMRLYNKGNYEVDGYEAFLYNSAVSFGTYQSGAHSFLDAPIPLERAVWYRITTTFSGGIGKIYNGTALLQSGAMIAPVAEVARTFRWGANSSLSSYAYFNGCLRNGYVYNRELSPGEIDLIINNAAPSDFLVHYVGNGITRGKWNGVIINGSPDYCLIHESGAVLIDVRLTP